MMGRRPQAAWEALPALESLSPARSSGFHHLLQPPESEASREGGDGAHGGGNPSGDLGADVSVSFQDGRVEAAGASPAPHFPYLSSDKRRGSEAAASTPTRTLLLLSLQPGLQVQDARKEHLKASAPLKRAPVEQDGCKTS